MYKTNLIESTYSQGTEGSNKNDKLSEAFAELEQAVFAALETYSNVHRGSGHYSTVTTSLYEEARKIVLDYLGLDKSRYVVIFCSPRKAEVLRAILKNENYHILSSSDFGLPLGVRALAILKNTLPEGIPFHAGGGTSRLISPEWIVWEGAPDRFEAGTPAIINVIAFARALQLIRKYGNEVFLSSPAVNLSTAEIFDNDGLDKYYGHELLNELKLLRIGRNIEVPTAYGYRPYINLDNSASTPTFLPIWNTFRKAWRQTGKVKLEIIQEVKAICSAMLGAPGQAYDFIFTSNATEAINLVAESSNLESEQDTESVVVNTILEHSSNELPWRILPAVSLIRLNADEEGFLDLNELETILTSYNEKYLYGKKRIKLVAVSGASNVLGSYNNLPAISQIVHKYGAYLLVDAAQLVAHRKVDIDKCGIDYFVFSAHKVYAPFGTGILVVKKGLLKFGLPEMEQIRTSGEENIGGIAALGKALLLLQKAGMNLIQEEEQALTVKALKGMSQIAGLRVFGINSPDSPKITQRGGIIVFNMKAKFPNKLSEELAWQAGIGTRYGCHCAHILIKHLLGVGPRLAKFQRILARLFPGLRFPGLVRVSFGIANTEEDVDTLILALERIAGKSLNLSNEQSRFQSDNTHFLPKAEVKQLIEDFVQTRMQKVYG
jgi:selenocysteine lyase/cysteine desulfurase